MAAIATPQLSAVRTSLPRSTVVAATAFVLAGALRLTSAIEEIGLSLGFVVFFIVVAVAQVGYGMVLSSGNRRATTTPVALAAMIGTLGLVVLWLIATTATVPIYPLMNGAIAVDVLDLATALLGVTSVVALCRSLPQRTRRTAVWSLVGLVGAAWLVWVVIAVISGLAD